MIKLDGTEQLILKLLFKSYGKLESYTTFKRSRVGFKAFSLSVRRLLENELIIEKESLLCLTEKGRDKILAQSSINKVVKHWRAVPSEFIIPQISPDDPYIPSISLLDKRTFT